MAAPSGTVWGGIAGGYGRVGIYASVSSTDTKATVSVETWFWSKYSVSDTANSYYYNNLASAGSATSLVGSISIHTSVDTGSGWSTSNQQKLGSSTYTYTRGTSAVTRYLYAKLTNVDRVGATMTASTTFVIPKLASYKVSYNANGGSGAPAGQTKWHGTTLKLSSTKPTRTGYAFQGWATSASGSVAYAAGANYTANAAATLYAVWKANTYKVSYNANGGTLPSSITTQTKTHGVTLTLHSTKPTRTNYTFLGWATSASATTAQYSAGGSYTANSAVTLYAVWKLAYTKPKISGVSVQRCDSEGVVNDEGTSAIVEFNWSTFQTVATVEIAWVAASVEKASETVDASGTSGSVSLVVGDGTISTDRTYTITITVTDGGGSTSVMRTLAGTRFVIDALAGGKGISFGKPAELTNHADFGYYTRFRENSTYNNNVGIYGKTVDDASLLLMTLNANDDLTIGYGPYTNGDNSTYLYGTDVLLGVKNTASPGTYRPYIRRGDSINVVIRTAGYVTNSGKDVSFFVSLARPIIGSPTVTVTSVNGFTLRQGTKYTHGSSAEVTVVPSSYTASYGYTYGVVITAVFSDTTNVTNNDAIGIYWSGTINFS